MVARSSESTNRGHASFVVSRGCLAVFSQSLQRECDAAQKKTGAKAVTSKQFAHLAMEADGKTPVAAIRLRLWPEKIAIDLGRVDFHERWVK